MKRTASVQDVSWFLDLESRGQLELNPPYQRRSVWTSSDRKFFLDTIFRNYPCPPIFIHKTIDENGKSTYNIVDGKQRLETILLFAKNKIAMSKEFGDERLDGLRFKRINQDMKHIFWNYSLPVDFMDIDGLDINKIFDRVNRNSRNLERQELRHARYDGWFIKEAEKEADEDPFWELIKVTSKAKGKRMKNVQLVSELLLIIIEVKIVGFDQDHLDKMYANLDSIDEEDGEVDIQFELDLEIYNEKKTFTKEFIRQMQLHNECITEKAKTNYNLHTLFALIILENLNEIDPTELAENYTVFMDLVDVFRQADDAEQLYDSEEEKPQNWELAYKYFKATRGANTDLPQRRNRLESLTTALI